MLKIGAAVVGNCILAVERTVAQVGTPVGVVFEDGVEVRRRWAEFG